MPILKAKHVTVIVDRGMSEKIAVTVFEHEIEVLRKVHVGGVTIVEGEDYAPVDIDVDSEFARLQNRYVSIDRNGNPETPAKDVYRNAKELADAIKAFGAVEQKPAAAAKTGKAAAKTGKAAANTTSEEGESSPDGQGWTGGDE